MRGWLATSSPRVVRLEEDSVVPSKGEGEEEEEEHRKTGIEQSHGVLQHGQHWGKKRSPSPPPTTPYPSSHASHTSLIPHQ